VTGKLAGPIATLGHDVWHSEIRKHLNGADQGRVKNQQVSIVTIKVIMHGKTRHNLWEPPGKLPLLKLL
jgi:hypothetical protein